MGLSKSLILSLLAGSFLGPSFTANFKQDTMPSDWVFTRSGVAWDNVDGVLTSFANNVPRMSVANGYLCEMQRTNSIRNGSAVGATNGVIGSGGVLPTNWSDVNTVGLTRTIVGSGVVNGFPYVDLKLSGTPTAGTYNLIMEALNQIAGVSGNIYSGSFWIGLMSGSMTGITSVGARVSGRASGGTETEGTTQNITPTIDPVRVSAIRTLNNGSTANVTLQMDAVVTAVPIDATFRISVAQLELGYGSTSPIPTTNAAITRNADLLYIPTNLISAYNNVGTFVFKGVSAKFIAPTVTQWIGHLSNVPTNSDEHRFFKDPYNFNYMHYQLLVSYGGAAFAEFNKSPDTGLGQEYIVAASWNVGASNVKVNVNGGTPATATVAALPNGCNRLYVGARENGTGHNCGYMTSIEYYPKARIDV